jgi:hypothetical protein
MPQLKLTKDGKDTAVRNPGDWQEGHLLGTLVSTQHSELLFLVDVWQL